MSNNKYYRNYQNYSNNQNKVNRETSVEEKQEVKEPAAEEVVEQPEVEAAVEAVGSIEEPVIEPVKVVGVVFDCEKLNVRKAASKESDSVGIIDAGCKVEIDEEKSTSDFYKICTAAGLEGFCMRKFIQVKS